jgi:hypothetical protein
LRSNVGEPHRILVVLFLPQNPEEWLAISSSELILKEAAFWVSLYGADATQNQTGETIYLPKANLLTPESLISICQGIGTGVLPVYQRP